MTEAKKNVKTFIALEPAVKTNDTKKRKRMKPVISGSRTSAKERGVVYISHLPHGFYEKELRDFLGQFGTVTNLKVGRSKKTGGSKGYAFAEFRYKDVASVVVKTMNNYLMFEKLLKCQLVPAERIRPAMFRGKINPKQPPLMVSRFKAKKAVNAKRTVEQDNKRVRNQAASLRKLSAKLTALGVDAVVDFPHMVAATPKKILNKSSQKTPIMEVDESDEDITLKTPPNVRKVKSRSNSAATSAVATPTGGTPSLSKLVMKKQLEAMKRKESPDLETVAAKLQKKSGSKHSTPKSAKATPKNTPAAITKSAKKENATKQTPKSLKNTPTLKKISPTNTPKQTPKSGKNTPKVKKISPKNTPKQTPKSIKTLKGTPKKSSTQSPKNTPKSIKTPTGMPKVKKTPKSGKK